MSAIKDVIDLVEKLANRVQDRKIASELHAIQTLIVQIQSEQAKVHEANTDLREERITLQNRVQELETEVQMLKSASPPGPTGAPTCPNCSTVSKPFYMSPIPSDFVNIENATHECPKCSHKVKTDNP